MKKKINHFLGGRKTLSLIFLIGFIVLQLNSPFQANLNYKSEDLNARSDIQEDFDSNFIENGVPESAAYNQNLTNAPDNVKVTLHQAYRNDSVVEITHLNSSINVPAPNASDFSSSFINFSVSSLSVSNYTETLDNLWKRDYDQLNPYPAVTSFTVPQDCYITNASFYTTKAGSNTGTMSIFLYNSTWDNGVNKPHSNFNEYTDIGEITVDNAFGEWETDIFNNVFLNNSLTANNTWYIGLYDDRGLGVLSYWGYDYDDSNGDNNNYTDSYKYDGNNWVLHTWAGVTVDFMAKVGLGLNSASINCSDINLSINDTKFIDNSLIHGSGSWISNASYHSNSGLLKFNFSSTWNNFQLNLDNQQINYTNSFNANTSYTAESGVNVYWTSEANFTAFDHRLNNNTVNFTIPLSWTPNTLKRGGAAISYSTFTNSTNKILTVFGSDAIDGNWTLKSQSTNLISSVKVGRGGKEITLAYSNETITFNATFSKAISGTVNLSVYSPSDIDNELNYTKEVAVTDATSVDFGSWTISDNISDYGEFRVQVYWQNSTDAGIRDTTVFIAAATNFQLLTNNNSEYLNSAAPFNISLYYTDVMKAENITGATVEYDLTLGGGWQSDATQTNADNTYNITVDPTAYAVGFHEIPIHLNKTKFMNRTLSFGFYVVNNTQLYEYTQASTFTAIRGQNTTYIFNYNQTWQNTPIDAATVSVDSLAPGLVWSYSKDGGGNYTIRINSSQVDVGTYTCNFTITKADYKTQQFSFDINIIPAQTSITFINQTDNIQRISDLNFTTYIKVTDTDNNWNVLGITPGSLSVINITGTPATWDTDEAVDWHLWEVGNGVYGVNVSLGSSGANRIDFGNYSVRLNISYLPNYNWSIFDLSFYVKGNNTKINLIQVNDADPDRTSGTPLIYSGNAYHFYQIIGSNEKFGIQLNFQDVNQSDYNIPSADEYFVSLDGDPALITSDFYVIGGIHYGLITLNQELPSGIYIIQIEISKLNYENASLSFNISIDDRTTESYLDSITQNNPLHINDMLIYNASNHTYIGYAEYNTIIRIGYNDTLSNNYITGANSELLYNGTSLGSHDSYVNNAYQWTIDPTNLLLGKYEITIILSKTFYETDIIRLNLTIILIPTNFTLVDIKQPDHNSSTLEFLDGSYFAYHPFDIIISASYYDTNISAKISAATGYLSYNGYNYTINSEISGVYYWIIPAENLSLTIKNATIFFTKNHYEDTFANFTIKVDYLSTTAQLVDISQEEHTGDTLTKGPDPWNNYTVYMKYGLNISLSFTDPTNSSTPIESAAVTFWLDGVSFPVVYSGTNFLVNINAQDLQAHPGDYVPVLIHFNETFHYNKTLEFNLTIVVLPTVQNLISITQPNHLGYENDELIPDPIYGSYRPFVAYNLRLVFALTDPIAGNSPITDAYVSFIYNGVPYNLTYNAGEGGYYYLIPALNLTLNQEIVVVHFYGAGLESKTLSLNLSAVNLPTSFSLYQLAQPDYGILYPSPPSNPNVGYIVYDSFDIIINGTYHDDNNSKPIEGAWSRVIYNSSSFYLDSYDSSFSRYGWKIEKGNLEPGLFLITIQMGLYGYENSTKTFNITIEVLATSIHFNENGQINDNDLRQPDRPNYLLNPVPEINDIYHVFIKYSVTIDVVYYNEIDNAPLDNADYAMLVYGGGSFNITGTRFAVGSYRFVIPATELILGLQNATLYFGKITYENATRVIFIESHLLSTELSIESLDQNDHQGTIAQNLVNMSTHTIYLPFDTQLTIAYTDLNNSLPISSATTASFFFNSSSISLDSQSNGYYNWNVQQQNLKLGIVTVEIYLELEDYQAQHFLIYLNITYVKTNGTLISIQQEEENLEFNNQTQQYHAFSPFNITLAYSFTDVIINSNISDTAAVNLVLNSVQNYSAVFHAGSFVFEISAEDLQTGNNSITLVFNLYGYENITVEISIYITAEYSVSIQLINNPSGATQGEKIAFVFQVTYSVGDEQVPLAGEPLTLHVNHPDINPITNFTDEDGEVYFEFVLPTGDYSNLEISIEYSGQMYGVAAADNMIEIAVAKPASIPFWVVYIVLAFVGFIAIAVTVQKKVIEPRRIHFTDLVMSSATIFEDAINIQHVMVIYKSWGTSIFFKSFAEESFDPDLISGFLSAVQSFGKELKTQSTLNEMSYGDKILLFADGEYIRVTLVLSKAASPFLKRNLSKFVNVFEVEFKDKLSKWHGELNVFQGAEDLIDDVLKTSVILPHQFNPDIKPPKDLDRALTKQVLSIARNLVDEQRPFLFLAQLLQMVLDETGKEAPEIILSITELLDKKVLIPIKIEQIEKPEMTEKQKQELHARVWQIPNKTNIEKEEIFEQLTQLPEAEREVALSSLLQKVTITSEYTKEEYEIPKFDNEKEARKEIKELISKAKKAFKDKQFDESLKHYEFAEVIAIQWNLKDIIKELDSVILSTTVSKERYIINKAKKQARKMLKSKNLDHAADFYQQALDAAHRLFQLGYQDVEEEIKTLTHKVMTTKKELPSECANEECISRDALIDARKKLLKFYNKNEKKLPFEEKLKNLTRLAAISNLLFKFGNASEIKNVKFYQKKLETLKKSLSKEPESFQNEYQAQTTVMQEMDYELDRMIKNALLDEKYLDAIILYQKRVNIAYSLGNIDQAVYLVGQIRAKLDNVPYLYDIIQEYKQKLAVAEEQQNQSEIQQYSDFIQLLRDLMFDFNLS